jgi:tRNA nucleotidyltransferase (CCA-adding enzyme)
MMCKLAPQTIDDILANGKIYEVGGAVRDHFMHPDLKVKDRDYLVTGIPYDDLKRLLKKHGRVDLVGSSFGVIKFTQSRHDQPYTFDVTLPRKEHSTGRGHKDFAVAFDPNLSVEEDLLRRDFTINAMAIALDSDALIDPLGGLVDLRNKQIRITSPQSFTEDPLRMLRAVQFAARFGFEIEAETLRSLEANADLIESVSAERITEELTKLLTLSEKPSIGFRLMLQTGLLSKILPELAVGAGVDQPGGYHRYDVFEHTVHCIDACGKDLRIRLAALFHDIDKPRTKQPNGDGATFYGHETFGARTARRVMERLRFPNDLARDVSTLVERHMFTTAVTDKGLRRLVRRVGVDLIFDLLDLRRADVIAQGMGGRTDDVDEFERNIREELDRKPPFSHRDLALDGRDIMRMFDLAPSPLVGEILDHLLEEVLDEPAHNTRDQLETIARNYFKMRIAE